MRKYQSNKNKFAMGGIAIILIAVSLVGGLGYITQGFDNWNWRDWLNSNKEISLDFPLSINYDDLTKTSILLRDQNTYIYYIDYDSLMNLANYENISFIVGIPSIEYAAIFEGDVIESSTENFYCVDSEIVDGGLLDGLNFGIVDNGKFNSNRTDDTDGLVAYSAGKSSFIVFFDEAERELPDDFNIVISSVESIQ